MPDFIGHGGRNVARLESTRLRKSDGTKSFENIAA